MAKFEKNQLPNKIEVGIGNNPNDNEPRVFVKILVATYEGETRTLTWYFDADGADEFAGWVKDKAAKLRAQR